MVQQKQIPIKEGFLLKNKALQTKVLLTEENDKTSKTFDNRKTSDFEAL